MAALGGRDMGRGGEGGEAVMGGGRRGGVWGLGLYRWWAGEAANCLVRSHIRSLDGPRSRRIGSHPAHAALRFGGDTRLLYYCYADDIGR